MTIQYGEGVELPDAIYDRAISSCRVDENDHWIWYGSMNTHTQHPQIGAMSIVNGQKKLKVVSVIKLVYVVRMGLCDNDDFPYQVRRDKKLCQDKRCVNPDHLYHIAKRPS